MRKEVAEEIKLDAEYFGEHYPDIYIEDNNIKQEGVYSDQAPYRGYTSSFYTEFGIKRMDSWYSKQIQNGHPDYTMEEFSKMIKCNPHLHNVIKTNLLDNLKSYHEKFGSPKS